MNKMAFSLLASIFLLGLVKIDAQTTSTASTTMATTTETLDASSGGKIGNPGAQIRFSVKAMDKIYSHAMNMISRAIRSMVIPDVIVPIGGGMLSIKSVRIAEAQMTNFDRQLLPPNKIRSRLTGGRIVSIGQWQYKAFNGARHISTGIFRTVVTEAALNLTNQLGRTWDNKPMVQTTDCKAYLGRFRIEIEGFGDNTTVIDQCENLLCLRIRSYFEDSVCSTARNYIKETINTKLSTFPTRINLCPTCNRFVLDYSLLMGEPKVTEEYIQAYLEGEVLSRGSVAAPFYATELASFDDRQERMISFPLSDFAINTLLHHAHVQQYRFSAFDLLPANSSTRDLLKLNCSTSTDARRLRIVRPLYTLSRQAVFQPGVCLGSVFDNSTIGQYSVDDVGDLVFKSQRPLQVVVRELPLKSYFGVNSGMIEAYGAAGSDGKRELLGRVEIQSLRGEFLPQMSGCNITGSVTIVDLQLMQPTAASIQSRVRSLVNPMLSKLAQLSTPILTEMFNGFFNQFVQFPIPLVEGYVCESPEFRWKQRTMQIDCDVRVLPDATRKTSP